MKTSIRLAAAALSFVAAGAALADDPTIVPPITTASNTARADVTAQVLAARAAGTLSLTDADFRKEQPSISVRSRADVRAEAAAAVATGEARLRDAEGSSYGHAAVPAAARTAGAQMVVVRR